MSPEQASGEPNIDHRSDQYSLAVVAYQMLSGRAPFEGETARAIIAKQLLDQPPPLDALVGSSWQSADFALSDRHGARSQLMSTIKIRQAGFADCIDTVDSYVWWWRDLQRRGLLPHPSTPSKDSSP